METFENLPTKKARVPWYRNYEYYIACAETYRTICMNVLNGMADEENQKVWSQIREAFNFNNAKIVYESNLIERAGLSEGETRKLIDEYFPVLPEKAEEFYECDIHEIGEQLIHLQKAINADGRLSEVQLSVSFQGKSKKAREVLHHFRALYLIQARYAIFTLHCALKRRNSTSVETVIKKLAEDGFSSEAAFTQHNIKRLHFILADGLIDRNKEGAGAGEYRIDSKGIEGVDIVLAAPGNIPFAMELYCTKSNELLQRYIQNNEGNLCDIAAQISYDFVRIHPFADFNGRLSRIIMNLVLQTGLLPGAVPIRGDKAGRKQYMQALKFANRGNLKPYAALIAKSVVDAFEQVDDSLRVCGLPTLPEIARKRKN